MKRSTDRILTTHTGSLPRPQSLVELMFAKETGEAVDAVLDSITDTLKGGGEVNFTGFGKFSTQHRKERQGVNPRNPTEKVTIPAATVPKFSAGSTLKSAVKSGGASGGF